MNKMRFFIKLVLVVSCTLLIATIAGAAVSASTFTVNETRTEIFMDGFPADALQFDVTNNQPTLGVYSVIIGAVPNVDPNSGFSDIDEWTGVVQGFLTAEYPIWTPTRNHNPGDNPFKVPQINGPEDSDTGNVEWDRSWNGELMVADSDRNFAYCRINWGDDGDDASTSGSGYIYNSLPDNFSGYDYAFHFWTKGPYTVSSGSDILPSDPIPPGMTYSFYVQDGYPSSPFAYTTSDDYSQNGFDGTVTGSGMTKNDIPPVPVPSTLFLLGSGLLGVAGVSRRK